MSRRRQGHCRMASSSESGVEVRLAIGIYILIFVGCVTEQQCEMSPCRLVRAPAQSEES